MKTLKEYIFESKKLDADYLEKAITSQVEEIIINFYGDENDFKKEVEGLLNDPKYDTDLLNEIISAIDAHDGKLTEDDLLNNFDQFKSVALKVLKEYIS